MIAYIRQKTHQLRKQRINNRSSRAIALALTCQFAQNNRVLENTIFGVYRRYRIKSARHQKYDAYG
ncbi:MAG: hypothetical protein KME60_26895 [Cyanomargarita calcarea GSE-NOS-MK-12-04C]|jgi:hypothetical protein|uniref:Uncharacterized protein n=1 Tax=Cyanomargarita calcarea GSE-NOS-MK-12-04C TaxID=2839659 RepID=A0A951QSQ0_9CYAN|nr:hypothetical protein [Cyanomargarita calcarea GSE-NOS-MK-12-04C]